MRLVFAVVLGLHGLVHLLGFVKAFRLAEVPALEAAIPPWRGALWLAAGAALLVAAALTGLEVRGWWLLVALAALGSQGLVVSSWRDAKVGTVVNVVALAGAVLGFAEMRFDGAVRGDVVRIEGAARNLAPTVSAGDLAALPAPVQRWLTRSGVVGRPAAQRVHLVQRGRMRTEPEGGWMDWRAEQWFDVERPAFVWRAAVRAFPGVHLAGHDRYLDGRGGMRIALAALVPVVDAEGPEIDQGARVRYLAEMVWFPSGALAEHVTWDTVDDTAARATLADHGHTVSGVFEFSPEGEVTRFAAERYYAREGGATLERWIVDHDAGSIQDLGGVRIPTRSTVTWDLAEGPFTWLELEVVARRAEDR